MLILTDGRLSTRCRPSRGLEAVIETYGNSHSSRDNGAPHNSPVGRECPTRQCVVAARLEVLREAHGSANNRKHSAVDPHDGTPRYSAWSDCNNNPSVTLARPKHAHSSTQVRQTIRAFVWQSSMRDARKYRQIAQQQVQVRLG